MWRVQWWCSFFFYFWPEVFFLGANLVQINKIDRWSWSLAPRPIRICRIRWWFCFFSFLDWKYPFWANLVQKFKIFSLSWNLVPTFFWICKIWWWSPLFCFGLFFASFFQKIHLAFWYYPINLTAVYSQRLEASGFSCYFKLKALFILKKFEFSFRHFWSFRKTVW